MTEQVELICKCCGRETGSLNLEQVRRSARFSPMEGAVFDILARGKGDWVKTERVAELLYLDDPNGGPDGAHNNISVWIMNIRKKLRYMHAPYMVESAYATGYRVVSHSPAPMQLPPRRRINGVPGYSTSTLSTGFSPSPSATLSKEQ